MKTSSVVHSVHAPVPQLDEEHQREAEHREHLVAHEHGGTRASAGWGHVLLLAGDTCSCWRGTRAPAGWGHVADVCEPTLVWRD